MTDSTHEFAYVYTCYDPAIRDAVLAYCDERFGKGNYFFDSDPGAAKNFTRPENPTFTDMVLWKMNLAVKVHPFNVMLIINHSVCGAYADAGITFTSPEAESAYHKAEMERTVEMLTSKFPDVKIEHKFFLKPEQKFKW
ncbi:MAG: hypothetical protein Q8R30_00190 [bacterium]|nr:hypothetical protein [bacterium]MDZ4285911.1 carbonic anhydrase [Candidatus Sungbacteria bacterium]